MWIRQGGPDKLNPQRLGAVGGQGRPADQARGPHRLNFATCRLQDAPLGRFGVLRPVAPSYKYKGGRE